MDTFEDRYHRWRPKSPMQIQEFRSAIQNRPEYSGTFPTGVEPGKRWRRHDGLFDFDWIERGGKPMWLLCEYGPEINGRCAVLMSRPLVRVSAPTNLILQLSNERYTEIHTPTMAHVTSWCEENLGYIPEYVIPKQDTGWWLKFRTEADITAFTLRWL